MPRASSSHRSARIARGFEDLYYSSKRTGSAAQEIKSFAYAVSQLGGNADDAVASLESLAVKIKSNPGYNSLIQKLGRQAGVAIDTAHGTEKIEEGLGQAFSRLSPLQQRLYANELGISESLLNAIVNYKELRKYQDEYAAKAKAMGVDMQQAAQDGKDLSAGFRSLGATFGVLKDKIGSDLFKGLTPGLKHLNDYILAHGQEISEVVVKIADALLRMFTYIVKHLPDIDAFVESIGGWNVALLALGAVVLTKVLGPLGSFLKILSSLVAIVPPGWLLGMLGLAGASLIEGRLKGRFDEGFNAVTGGPPTEETKAMQSEGVWGLGKRLWRDTKRFLGGGGSAEDGRRLLGRSRNGSEAIASRGHRAANTGELMKAAQDQLMKEGLSAANAKAAAAALVGNVIQESGGDPNKSHDGGTGYGLYGARKERRTKMFSWLENNGYARNSAEGQMRYMATKAMNDPTYRDNRGGSPKRDGDQSRGCC